LPILAISFFSWADKVNATDKEQAENGCNYSGKIGKEKNKTG